MSDNHTHDERDLHGVALEEHDHFEEYAEWDHEHEEYADVEHDHDEDYAYDDHDHEELADREHEHVLDDLPDAASADDLAALEERVRELEAKLKVVDRSLLKLWSQQPV